MKKHEVTTEATPRYNERHHKEITAELRKKNVNEEAVRRLQALTFESCTDDIWQNFRGANVVPEILKKYPFLEKENQVMFYGPM